MNTLPELTIKKSAKNNDGKYFLQQEVKKVDVLLSLVINLINKKDESDKCICSYCPVSSTVYYENEVIPDIEVNQSSDGKIKLSDVIVKLKQCGYPLTGSMITIYSKIVDEYITCGADPLDKMIMLDDEQINLGIIKLKCTCFIDEKFLCKNAFNFNTSQNPSTTQLGLSRNNSVNDIKCKRTKERKIGYIIEKVNLWRRLYNGFYNEEGKFIKNSLDEAAKVIGVSKKSLDDYLLQLRLGRKYGFNFNGNKENKVGILRSFVKKNRLKTDNFKNETDDDL